MMPIISLILLYILSQDYKMSKQLISPRKTRTKTKNSSQHYHSCGSHKNPIILRKNMIESYSVFHPMLDRLMEIKMAKCFQHGHVRSYHAQANSTEHKNSKNLIQAPSIQGAIKIFSIRPKTSQVNLNYGSTSGRPKSTNTVIRSRTSQPRIQRKLEIISKQPTQFDEQQLKPSLFINRIRRSYADGSSQI